MQVVASETVARAHMQHRPMPHLRDSSRGRSGTRTRLSSRRQRLEVTRYLLKEHVMHHDGSGQWEGDVPKLLLRGAKWVSIYRPNLGGSLKTARFMPLRSEWLHFMSKSICLLFLLSAS